MNTVSIGAAWTETNLFIRREAGLLFPVVFLFIAIPMAIVFYMIPPGMREMAPGQAGEVPTLPGMSIAVIILCSLVMIGGSLCCYALGVKPGISLREALIIGLRRVPVALAAGLIVGFAVGIPMMFLSLLSKQIGALFMLVAVIIASARLLLLNAVVVDSSAGALNALRASWDLSRGNMGRLLLFVMVMAIPIMLGQIVAELLFGLVGMTLGGAEIGRQAGDVGAATALAIGQVYMIVMTSRIYRQLTSGA